jgi:hypothetical protein
MRTNPICLRRAKGIVSQNTQLSSFRERERQNCQLDVVSLPRCGSLSCYVMAGRPSNADRRRDGRHGTRVHCVLAWQRLFSGSRGRNGGFPATGARACGACLSGLDLLLLQAPSRTPDRPRPTQLIPRWLCWSPKIRILKRCWLTLLD